MKAQSLAKKFMLLLVCITMLFTMSLLAGCKGDDGAAGAPGAPGQDVTAVAKPESCIICHEGQGAEGHQAIYNDYVDTTLAITIDSVVSTASTTTGEFDTTVLFTVEKNGQPYTMVTATNFKDEFDQETIYAVQYDSATGTFSAPKSAVTASVTTTGTDGQFSAPIAGLTFRPEASNAQVYIYVAKGRLDTEGMALYADVANQGQAFGDAGTYASTANVSGCEKCHGAPYKKHGYRMATVSGLADFAACKVCHYDNRKGGHEAWQLLVDDVARYAALQAEADASPATDDSVDSRMTGSENARYAYTANVMNDTHMTHAMEFAYPQEMANCVTCHEGKLVSILTDTNFTVATCRSCHPVTGTGGTDPKRAPALLTVIPNNTTHSAVRGNLYADATNPAVCNGCHSTGNLFGAPLFSAIHTGYNSVIYAADGTKYADAVTATISSATLTNNILNIKFSVADSLSTGFTVTPTVQVSFYGYDAKDFIVSCHTSDANGKRMEKTIGTANTLFTEVSSTVVGNTKSWEVNLDLAAYAKTPSIPQMIADGTIKRFEVAVLPNMGHPTKTTTNRSGQVIPVALALNAPSKTVDIASNGFVNYYAPIVDANKCNTCHEALGTTFHSADRGGNVTVCRMCHTTFSGGSHLELQSRSIDSYVHAIHSFQPFDIGDIDFTNPEETLHVRHHLESAFPNFTIKNCEACHTTAGVYEVPNQTKSLPGILSGSDYVEGRNINNVPAYVSGPATRACGGCHRAVFVNEDDANGLASFNEHTKANGYLIPDGPGVLDEVIKTIHSYFD